MPPQPRCPPLRARVDPEKALIAVLLTRAPEHRTRHRGECRRAIYAGFARRDRHARLKARQGVKNSALAELMVADPETMHPAPADGQTIGEIFMRGNNVMSGYLKNPAATAEAFRGGWFASGDLGVMHPDGYMELKDRLKDIIISGGENISSIEIEDALYRHPAVLEVAVVARPDQKWGETPCAFVTLEPGQSQSPQDIIEFCRSRMAHFKAPRTVIFGELPKTSTGKIQKFRLRDEAKKLGSL